MKPTGPNISDLTKLFRRNGRAKGNEHLEKTSDVLRTTLPRTVEQQKSSKTNRTSVVSLRLTADERQRLESFANGKPLSTFIRNQVLGEDATPRKPVRSVKRPACDEVAVARVLRKLGEARMLKELETLHWALEIGSVSLSKTSEMALQQACADIKTLRRDLMRALGLRVTT